MSASHRKLHRLPLSIFEDLSTSELSKDPSHLKTSVTERLKRCRARSKRGTSKTLTITTVEDLLHTPRITLLQALDPFLTFDELNKLLERVSLDCTVHPIKSSLLLDPSMSATSTGTMPNVSVAPFSPAAMPSLRYLTTGLPTLDGPNAMGVRVGSVTEIVGRAGVGKTQLALQLILRAAQATQQGAIYIDTERKLIVERLREMTVHALQQSSLNTAGNGLSRGIRDSNMRDTPSVHPNDILQNLTVKQPNGTEQFLQVLEEVEEDILRRNQKPGCFPVRLLIVDSITAPMRKDFGIHDIPKRAATVFSIAQTLKRYADKLNLAVVVLNQVGLEGGGGGFGNQRMETDNSVAVPAPVRPALGTSWHHCVSTRILLELETSQTNHDESGDTIMAIQHTRPNARLLSVVKSNWMPLTTLRFEITGEGLVEIPDTMEA
eukprot:Nitzschia sp. Nitz4//scaffold112_size70979//11357//12759//NITZ4_005893-RA/size70979-augustus-gene-0.78-mRNA-1//1//CDS//3329533238//5915//frame0